MPRSLAKTVTFALLHFTVGFAVTYALTGSAAIYSDALESIGQFDEAVREFRAAIELDPKEYYNPVQESALRLLVRTYTALGDQAKAARQQAALDALLRTFPIRTCTANKFQRHARLGKPCLYAHIEQCVAPCVDAVTVEQPLSR